MERITCNTATSSFMYSSSHRWIDLSMGIVSMMVDRHNVRLLRLTGIALTGLGGWRPLRPTHPYVSVASRCRGYARAGLCVLLRKIVKSGPIPFSTFRRFAEGRDGISLWHRSCSQGAL